MENVRFDFSDLHRHGRAFYEFLALRKQVFVDELKWDVPHNDSVEMDQYDTPMAHYSIVLHEGRVIGGARAMATTATWGEHTYMLRDAYSGKLKHIPPHIMSVDIASPKVWEATRLVIASDIATQAERSECMTLIVDGLVDIVRRHEAEEMICLSSLHLMRALRQLGYKVDRLGETYQNSEDGRTYGVLRMPADYSNARKASTRPHTNLAHLSDARPRADLPRADLPRADLPRADLPRADLPRADLPRADQPPQAFRAAELAAAI